MIAVDFPIAEARAILARLAPDTEKHSMSRAECGAAETGRQRLQQAVAVETGPSGSEELSLEDLAVSLIGQRVRVCRFDGSVRTGTMLRLAGFRTAVLEVEDGQYPVNLSLVRTIEAAKRRPAETKFEAEWLGLR